MSQATVRSFDLRGLVLPVALVVVAELLVRGRGLESDAIAAPSRVAVAWYQALLDGTLLSATAETLACAIGGLAIGFVLGMAMGTVFGLLSLADHLMEVTVEAIRPIPPVALIPVALLVYGFGYRLEIAVVAFATVWPAMIFTRTAIRGITPRLFEVARALELTPLQRVVKLVIPAALPQVFVALRLSAAISLVVAVTVEVTSNTIGLGHEMMMAQSSLQPDLMLALLVWTGVLGWMINAAMLAAQRLLFPFSIAERTGKAAR